MPRKGPNLGRGGSINARCQTRVLAAVIQRDGRFLLCRRPAQKRHGGLWEFPGGKLLASETHADAARRELAEELGVEVCRTGRALFSAPDPGSEFLIEFVGVDIDGEPQMCEHQALAWVPVERLADYPMPMETEPSPE